MFQAPSEEGILRYRMFVPTYKKRSKCLTNWRLASSYFACLNLFFILNETKSFNIRVILYLSNSCLGYGSSVWPIRLGRFLDKPRLVSYAIFNLFFDGKVGLPMLWNYNISRIINYWAYWTILLLQDISWATLVVVVETPILTSIPSNVYLYTYTVLGTHYH